MNSRITEFLVRAAPRQPSRDGRLGLEVKSLSLRQAQERLDWQEAHGYPQSLLYFDPETGFSLELPRKMQSVR